MDDDAFRFGPRRFLSASMVVYLRFNCCAWLESHVLDSAGVAMLSSVLRNPRAVLSFSASTGERATVRCRFEAANLLSRHATLPAAWTAGTFCAKNAFSLSRQGRRDMVAS